MFLFEFELDEEDADEVDDDVDVGEMDEFGEHDGPVWFSLV